MAGKRLSWANAHWASGPKVAKWVESQRFLIDHKSATARRLSYWRSGTQASFWALDYMLSAFEHHVSELPDDVWETRVDKQKHEFTPKPCRRCGKEIPRANKAGKPEPPSRYCTRSYCSVECRAEQTEERKCKRCGKGFVFALTRDTGEHSGVFCSRDCMREAGRDAQRQKRKANWKSNVDKVQYHS